MRYQNRLADAQQKRNRIDRIYEHLDDVVALIPDADLQDRVLDWMDRADEAPAGSLLTAVESKLAEFETEYEMYAVEMDGEANFPDECSDCEHYGIECPVLTRPREKTERKRLRDELEGASEDKTKRELRRFAGRNKCIVIINQIDDWEEDFEGLLEEGRNLRRETIHLLRPADEKDRADAELGEAAADATEGRV